MGISAAACTARDSTGHSWWLWQRLKLEASVRRSATGGGDGASSVSTSHWHPEKQCDHGLTAAVKYSWTILNPGRRFACCPKEQEKQCSYMAWVDPEWDERAYVVMVKLMKKKMQAEEDAKKSEEDLGKAKLELGEIREELKAVQQQLQKSTAELKSIQDYRHNVKLVHVVLALFVVVAAWMLGGKAT